MPENYEIKEQLRKDRDRRNRERVRLQNEERNSKAKSRSSIVKILEIVLPIALIGSFFFFTLFYPLYIQPALNDNRIRPQLQSLEKEFRLHLAEGDLAQANYDVIDMRQLVADLSSSYGWKAKLETYETMLDEAKSKNPN